MLWGAGYIVLSGPSGPRRPGRQAHAGGPVGAPRPPPPAHRANGKQLFTANCAACHQANGKRGLPGVFPPLDGSRVGGRRRAHAVANILLHGITGEITVMGTTFKGAMPAFAQLSDAELAAVASYVRAEVVQQGGRHQTRAVRSRTQGRLRAPRPSTAAPSFKALMAKVLLSRR